MQLPLYILKLGGAAITYKKSNRYAIRKKRLREIAVVIAEIMQHQPCRLIVVHGAGPFGHRMVTEYAIKDGISTPRHVHGFVATHNSMETLNKAVIESMLQLDLHAITVQPSACLWQNNKQIAAFSTTIIRELLQLGTIPVLYGDVVIDTHLGASVVSGDAIIAYLAQDLHADKVLFGTDVDGVFTADPRQNPAATIIPAINDDNIDDIVSRASHSLAMDVTAGMKGKLQQIRDHLKGIECAVFNLKNATAFEKILRGQNARYTRIFFTQTT